MILYLILYVLLSFVTARAASYVTKNKYQVLWVSAVWPVYWAIGALTAAIVIPVLALDWCFSYIGIKHE